MALSDRLESDLSKMMSVSHLASTVTITKQGGGVLSIPAHFEITSVSAGAAEWGADIGVPQEVFIPHPSAIVKTSDVLGVKKGDVLQAKTVNYKIRELQADGTGVTEIILWQP